MFFSLSFLKGRWRKRKVKSLLSSLWNIFQWDRMKHILKREQIIKLNIHYNSFFKKYICTNKIMDINIVKCQQCFPLEVGPWVLLSCFFQLLLIFPKFHKWMYIISQQENILNKEAQCQLLNIYLWCMDTVHQHFCSFCHKNV